MKKKFALVMKKSIFSLGLMLFLITSCTKDFEELNTNKIAPSEAIPSSLLSGIIFEPLNAHLDVQSGLTNQVMQYMVWRNDNNLDRYDFAAGDATFTAFWQRAYKAHRDYKDLSATVSGVEALKPYEAVAKILDAFYMASVSELWIDAPYTKSGAAQAGDLSPAYDSQETIYKEVLKNLETANTDLTGDGKELSQGGDLIFGGSVLKWRKFANSLRLRYLLRLSNKSDIDAKTKIKQIMDDSDKYPIISSNEESAIYDFSGVAPNTSNYSLIPATRVTSAGISERFVAKLSGVDAKSNTADDDPRLAFFGRIPACNDKNDPADSKCKKEYLGVPSGVLREEAQGVGGNAELYSSFVTAKFQDTPGLLDFVFISYAEVQFILAEVRMKGWITQGTAQTYYENGIKANLAYWNITEPSGFTQRDDVKWDNTLERLMEQKWIAMLWNNTLEMWAEQRRTGFPNILTTLGSSAKGQTSQKIATRVFYPSLEQSVNSANYKKATEKFGANDASKITAKHWYQN